MAHGAPRHAHHMAHGARLSAPLGKHLMDKRGRRVHATPLHMLLPEPRQIKFTARPGSRSPALTTCLPPCPHLPTCRSRRRCRRREARGPPEARSFLLCARQASREMSECGCRPPCPFRQAEKKLRGVTGGTYLVVRQGVLLPGIVDDLEELQVPHRDGEMRVGLTPVRHLEPLLRLSSSALRTPRKGSKF